MSAEWVSAIANFITSVAAVVGVCFGLKQLNLIRLEFEATHLGMRLPIYKQIVILSETSLGTKLGSNLNTMTLGEIVRFREVYEQLEEQLKDLKFEVYAVYPDKKTKLLFENLISKIEEAVTGKFLRFTYDLEHYSKHDLELKFSEAIFPAKEIEEIYLTYQQLRQLESDSQQLMNKLKNTLAFSLKKSEII